MGIHWITNILRGYQLQGFYPLCSLLSGCWLGPLPVGSVGKTNIKKFSGKQQFSLCSNDQNLFLSFIWPRLQDKLWWNCLGATKPAFSVLCCPEFQLHSVQSLTIPNANRQLKSTATGQMDHEALTVVRTQKANILLESLSWLGITPLHSHARENMLWDLIRRQEWSEIRRLATASNVFHVVWRGCSLWCVSSDYLLQESWAVVAAVSLWKLK